MKTKQINWEKLLIDAGIFVPRDNYEFNIQCPFHNDHRPSLSINTQKGLYICHAGCGQGSLITFLSHYLGVGLIQLYKRIYEESEDDEWIFDIPSDTDVEILPEVLVPYSLRTVPQWIFKRQFTKPILLDWECGYDECDGSLVIPVRDEYNRVVGWIKRLAPGREPRYLYGPTKQFKKSRIVFGLSRVTSGDIPFVCVTEGALNTIWLWQHGFCSVALLGAKLSVYQEQLLQLLAVPEIVLCFDNDLTGRLITQDVVARLSKYFIITMIQLPSDINDVQDIRDPQLLKSIIANRSYSSSI